MPEPELKPAPAAPAAGTDPNAPPEGSPPVVEGTPPGAQVAPQWALNRLSKITAEKKELEDRLAAALAGKKPAGDDPPDPNAPVLTEAEIERRVNERSAQNALAMQCNAMYETGKKEFPDFEESVKIFKTLGGLPLSVVEAAFELGEAHKILYNLSRDPEEASRVLSLPVARQAAALTKYKGGVPAKTISNAPPPVGPKVGGGGGNSGSFNPANPNQSMDDYVAGRAAQKKERAEARRQLGRLH